MAEKPSSDKQESYTLPVTVSGSGSAYFKIKNEEYQVTVIRPSPSVSAIELQISLKRNRKMLSQSAKDMEKLKLCKKKVDDLSSPTRNALLARANIDLLVPLINMKGGEARFEGKEALLIEKHIEKIRDDAAKKVKKQIEKETWSCFWKAQGNNPLIFIMIVVVLTLIFLTILYLLGFI
ncbi:MAG TPA: hypothetical protein EYH38_05325 [Leucothrix sp.]|nr:hypothetical protein [Leucothrix sp.]